MLTNFAPAEKSSRDFCFLGCRKMAARKGQQFNSSMSNDHRVKIQNSNILNVLIEHAEGKREMSATQVSAGLGLLKKVLPDLSASENKTEMVHRYVARIPQKAATADQWQQQHSPQTTLQ